MMKTGAGGARFFRSHFIDFRPPQLDPRRPVRSFAILAPTPQPPERDLPMPSSDLRSENIVPWQPSQRYPDPAIQILDQSFARYRVNSASVERIDRKSTRLNSSHG